MIEDDLFFQSKDNSFKLFHGDTINLLPRIEENFDMVFADPPYFLSNGGNTIQNGKIASVNKGEWDKLIQFTSVYGFNHTWLKLVRDRMKEDATIWVSGTIHNIFSIGQALINLDFKILNVIVWKKSNPPPNLSCRVFTHSTELIIWARKHQKVAHYFDYHSLKRMNGNRQMKDVWELPSVGLWEKSCGKHPTQKPLSLLKRIVLASTKPNDWILDPFAGSCTAGIAASLFERSYIGIDQQQEYLEIGKKRKSEIENQDVAERYLKLIK
jgi:site-specific DNA-methyltransferase (adenine-specific)